MRTLGYLFGTLLLLDAVPSIFSPHYWVHFSSRNLKEYLPHAAMRTVTDFGTLSENAVRTKALTEIVVGLMLIFMASMIPTTRYFAFGRGMRGGPMPHMHPHAHGQMKHMHEHTHEGGEEGTEVAESV